MNNVTSICQQPKFFTLEEADALIPLISKITEKNEGVVQKLLDDQRYYAKTGAPLQLIQKADVEVGKQLTEWGTKLVKLGCKVFGMGYVGLDSGAGFWSWHYGDGNKIKHFHGYVESPLQRKQVIRDQKV